MSQHTLAPGCCFTTMLPLVWAFPQKKHVCSRPVQIFFFRDAEGEGEMADPGEIGIAWRAARHPDFPVAHGSTARTDPGCPCTKALAALLETTKPRGEEEGSYSPAFPS